MKRADLGTVAAVDPSSLPEPNPTCRFMQTCISKFASVGLSRERCTLESDPKEREQMFHFPEETSACSSFPPRMLLWVYLQKQRGEKRKIGLLERKIVGGRDR